MIVEGEGYKLICGDCLDVLPRLASGSVDAVVTDPPYGINLQNHSAGKHRRLQAYKIHGDGCQSVGVLVNMWALQHNLPTVFFASPSRPWPGKWRSHLVWDKGGAVGGGGDPELCWKQTWELIQVARNNKLNGGRDNGVGCGTGGGSVNTYGDLFTGFGGATLGAMATGLRPLWGVEYDARIAAVANDNLGGHVIHADILDIDPHTLPRVDVLHASPPCPSFSRAKTNGAETQLDIDLARKVAQFVAVLQPQVFTLENVYAYRGSQSWAIIQDALFGAGYWLSIDHVNAADLGVAQTRQRMIVRAVRGGWVPYLPEPVRWVGWYKAIEDLIPGLPDSQFANWQLKRLPQELRTCMVQVQGEVGDGVKFANEPMQTVSATHAPGKYRAFLVGPGGFDSQIVTASNREPSFTVTANSNQGQVRAFLVGGANTSDEQAAAGVGVSMPGEPTRCINASNSTGWRAWLVDSTSATPADRLTTRGANEPAITVTSGGPKHPMRGLLQHGRIVAMTPRALARFQSFPDTYTLPENKTLAARGIGNACPPLMMRRIYEGLIA